MFKNLIIYRTALHQGFDIEALAATLLACRFTPCGATQPISVGWVPPRGLANAPMIESVGGHHLIKLMVEQKVVPGSVIKRRTDEIAKKIEDDTGRKPGKKQTKEIKEQALLDLLPMAFTKQSSVQIWLAPTLGLLMMDASSQGKADEIVAQVVTVIDGLEVRPLQTESSPAAMMAHWLVSGEPPSNFTVDRELELKSTDEMKSSVRYGRHALDIEEIRQHITGGKAPTKLALTWNGRVSFVLSDTLVLKKLAFLEGVFEGMASVDKDEAFDADLAILTGELSQLIPDLVGAMGGEYERKDAQK